MKRATHNPYCTIVPDAYVDVIGEPWPLRLVPLRLLVLGRRVPVLVDVDHRQLLADANLPDKVLQEVLATVNIDGTARALLGLPEPLEVF